ncbi:MAG: hypothetical protein HYX21_03530 [Candidatus Yanofskybacteria bacterium]|nr:hypothetical protein [Candidatus Yanofskybacteria bacterium]
MSRTSHMSHVFKKIHKGGRSFFMLTGSNNMEAVGRKILDVLSEFEDQNLGKKITNWRANIRYVTDVEPPFFSCALWVDHESCWLRDKPPSTSELDNALDQD